jgi:hypothetical protein
MMIIFGMINSKFLDLLSNTQFKFDQPINMNNLDRPSTSIDKTNTNNLQLSSKILKYF